MPKPSDVGWEEIHSPYPGDYLDRIPVPGGWVYRAILRAKEGTTIAMTFVPNPNNGNHQHAWRSDD